MTEPQQQADAEKQIFNPLCNGEEKELTECVVKGSIPLWLSGQLFRNGPGEFDIGTETFKHLFDGHALVHRFDVKEGKVSYMSRFLRSETYKKNHEYNRIVLGGFGTASIPDPCKSLFSRFFTKLFTYPVHDNCSINIATLGTAYYAIQDGSTAYRIDAASLDTKNMYSFQELFGIDLTTAHPHYDGNGDYYNLGSSFGKTGYYGIFKVPAASLGKEDPLQDLTLHSKIPIDEKWHPSYFHSFGLSENYIVLHDQIVRLNALKIMVKKLTWSAAGDAIQEDTERESVFHVVDKKKQEKLPTKYAAEGKFCFHHINAFEEEKNGKTFLVVDIVCGNRGIFALAWLHYLRQETLPEDRAFMYPYRFVLPLNVSSETPKGKNLVDLDGYQATAVVREDGSVFLTPELLIEERYYEEYDMCGVELPTINYEKYNRQKYRYLYGIGEKKLIPDQLLKVDVQKKTAMMWKEKDRFPSEPIFVQRPDSSEEDDGVVLSTVVSRNPSDPVFLLVLDGKTFTEIARAEVMTKLCYPFHGKFTTK